MPADLQKSTVEENDGSTAQSEATGQGDPLADNETLQNVVKNLINHFQTCEKFARRQEVIDTRQQRFYWRNDQYIYWNYSLWAFVPVSGGSGGVGGGMNTSVDMPRYTDVYNIYTPYMESLIAPLSQNPPGVNFEPDDPMRPVDVTKAKAAQKYKQQIDRDNPQKALRSEVARLMCTDTRIILYTRPLRDEQELGQDEDGKPNVKQLITAHGTLETKVVPMTAKTRGELVAAFISDEMEINIGKETYPNAADKIAFGASSIGESSYERFARLGVLQGQKLLAQAGDALKYVVTRHRVWLRPSAFNEAPKEYIETLKQKYPSGCKVILCGGAWCTSCDESMDDHLSIGFPSPGDGMSRASLGKRMVPLQDAFNDGMNLWHEANNECIPETWMHQELGDIDALREQIAAPGNHIPVELPPGLTALADAFYTPTAPGIPTSLPQALELLQGPLSQFISGALPALIGDSDPNNETKGGIQMLRDSALGRVGIPWGAFQELFAEAYRQSVEGAAQSADDEASFTFERRNKKGKTIGSEAVKYSDLKKGNIRAYPDLDSSFPETTNAKRSVYMGLVNSAESNPVIAETMAVPDNIEMGYELIGLPDLVIPGAEARQKQLEEIQELLREPPIPPPMQAWQHIGQQKPELVPAITSYVTQQQAAVAAKGPMPVPPKVLWPFFAPSVDVDKEDDYHKYESDECKRWLSSEERREQDKAGNQLGVMNVKLHKAHHDAALAAQEDQAGDQKPPNATINLKDLPPDGQVQLAAQRGIKLSPPSVIANQQQTAPAGLQ